MASAPIWWECVWHIVDALRGAELMAEVQVEDSYPGEQAATGDELVFVREVVGLNSSIPVMTDGAKHYDDEFDVVFVIDVRGRPTIRAAQVRVSEIQGAIHKTLAGDPTLADLDGVVSAVISERRQAVVGGTDGPVGFGEVTVSIHSRIQPD